MSEERREIFRTLRDRLGYTVEQIAEAIGKSAKTVEGYLGNHRGTPTKDAVERLTKVYFERCMDNLRYLEELKEKRGR